MGDHLIGNVYAKYSGEDEAELAARSLNGRYYAGRIISTEFSPVTDFKEARCRQYDEGNCDRGGYCNFMHLKHISRSFKKSLQHQMYYEHPEYKQKRILRIKEEQANARKKMIEKSPVKKQSPEYKRQSSAERRAMIDSWNRKEVR